MALRKPSSLRGRSKRSKATSEGMRRSAQIAAKYGISRGQRDAQNLTRKDRIVRVVLDALAAGVEVAPKVARELLPKKDTTISKSTFDRYVKMAIGGERNVPKGRIWPQMSRSYQGDASAHERRVANIQGDKSEPHQNGIERRTGKPKVQQQPNPILRQQVETAAVEITEAYFIKTAYNVKSVETDNLGWDLEAVPVRGKRKLRVEVKGLRGSQLCVELTPNEYIQMALFRDSYRLCIVTSALSMPDLSVFAYSNKKQAWTDQNGRLLEIEERVAARCRAA